MSDIGEDLLKDFEHGKINALEKFIEKPDSQKGQILIVKNFSPRPFSHRLLSQHRLFTDKYGRFWIYNQDIGLWEENAETILEAELRKEIMGPETLKRHYVGEILADVKALCFKNTDVPEPDRWFIPFNNGAYDLKRGQVVSYSENLFFTTKLAVDFNPRAECPMIDRIFSKWVEPYRVIDLYEIIAYCMLRSYPAHKMFFLYGRGRNGKSTYLRILENVLGKENISSVSLLELQNERFSTAELCGRFANISSELDYRELRKTDRIKRLTGGDLIRGERKYQPCFYFRNHAKLIFNTNELPKTVDKTLAFYRRIHLVEFPYVFSGGDDDKSLLSKISKEEYQGLAAKSITNLHEMAERGFTFTREMDDTETERVYEQLTNPLNSFITECCEKEPNSSIPKIEFKERFLEWSDEKGYRRWTDDKIGKEMKLQGFEDGKITIERERQRCWLGLKWRIVPKVSRVSNLSMEFPQNPHIYRKSYKEWVDTSDRSATSSSGTGDPSPSICSICKGTRFWRLRDGKKWVCEVCHPPVTSDSQIVWSDSYAN